MDAGDAAGSVVASALCVAATGGCSTERLSASVALAGAFAVRFRPLLGCPAVVAAAAEADFLAAGLRAAGIFGAGAFLPPVVAEGVFGGVFAAAGFFSFSVWLAVVGSVAAFFTAESLFLGAAAAGLRAPVLFAGAGFVAAAFVFDAAAVVVGFFDEVAAAAVFFFTVSSRFWFDVVSTLS